MKPASILRVAALVGLFCLIAVCNGCMTAVVRGVAMEAVAARGAAGALGEAGAGRVLVGMPEVVGESAAGAAAAGAISESLAVTAMRVGGVAAVDTEGAALAIARNPVSLTTGQRIVRLSVRKNRITVYEERGSPLGSAEIQIDGRVMHYDSRGNATGVSVYEAEARNVVHYTLEGGYRKLAGNDVFRIDRVDHYGPHEELLGSTPWYGEFRVPVQGRMKRAISVVGDVSRSFPDPSLAFLAALDSSDSGKHVVITEDKNSEVLRGIQILLVEPGPDSDYSLCIVRPAKQPTIWKTTESVPCEKSEYLQRREGFFQFHVTRGFIRLIILPE